MKPSIPSLLLVCAILALGDAAVDRFRMFRVFGDSEPEIELRSFQNPQDRSRRLPLIYWLWDTETAPYLKGFGIDRIAVPPEKADEWTRAGFKVLALSEEELGRRTKVHAPRISERADEASATHRPWIESSGWRFVRDPDGKFYYDLAGEPPERAALAAAEAFVYRADVILKAEPAELEKVGPLLRFLGELPQAAGPALADIGLVDDGQPLTGEVMNLLIRRNLLFRIVPAPARQLPINVQLGTREFPRREAADPSAFAQKLRRKLTDERRTLRIFGSEVVIGRLTGERGRIRLQLLNYGEEEIDGLRVRVRGTYRPVEAVVYGRGRAPLEDVTRAAGFTEFSIPNLGIYGLVELTIAR